MYNIEHLKGLIEMEIEAILIEVKELKKRVMELELGAQPLHTRYQDNIEYVGRWAAGGKLHVEEHSTVTCNTNVIS